MDLADSLVGAVPQSARKVPALFVRARFLCWNSRLRLVARNILYRQCPGFAARHARQRRLRS